MWRLVLVIGLMSIASPALAQLQRVYVDGSGFVRCGQPTPCTSFEGCEDPASTCQEGQCRYGENGEFEVLCCAGDAVDGTACTLPDGREGRCMRSYTNPSVCIDLAPPFSDVVDCVFAADGVNNDCVAGHPDGEGQEWVPRWGGEESANCDHDACRNDLDSDPCVSTSPCERIVPIDAGVIDAGDADGDVPDADARDADARDADAFDADVTLRDAAVEASTRDAAVADATSGDAEIDIDAEPGAAIDTERFEYEGGGGCSVGSRSRSYAWLAIAALLLLRRRR